MDVLCPLKLKSVSLKAWIRSFDGKIASFSSEEDNEQEKQVTLGVPDGDSAPFGTSQSLEHPDRAEEIGDSNITFACI